MSISDPVIRLALFGEIVDLRHDVLRHGLPREAAVFPGDEAPTTRHFGAFAGDRNIGCATVHATIWEETPAWQLRGMATHADFRGCGLGRKLLTLIEQTAATEKPPVRIMWCNARVPAVGFYESAGWRVVSDVFEIPTAGPHRKMVKTLTKYLP